MDCVEVWKARVDGSNAKEVSWKKREINKSDVEIREWVKGKRSRIRTKNDKRLGAEVEEMSGEEVKKNLGGKKLGWASHEPPKIFLPLNLHIKRGEESVKENQNRVAFFYLI